MSTKVHLYSNLQRYASDQPVVPVEGTTVGECLNHLVQQYPLLNPIIFDKNRSMFPHIYVSVNLKSAKSEQLDRLISPGDELYIILVVVGG